MSEQLVIMPNGLMGLVNKPAKAETKNKLRSAVILRIGQLKDDRQQVRHRLEYDANAKEFTALRRLDKLLTLTIIELEKHL